MDRENRDSWLGLDYAAAIFTSAFLLFQIQPLVSKHILPWFGGSTAVWTTCLLFFQALLFAGYAYAHFSHSRLTPRRQAVLHGALIVAALIVALLHVLPDTRWEPHGHVAPIGRILLVLFISVGLPYFVLSATGPLLQAWFARSFPGRTPYRLYALSNLGSLLALVSYPFIFEPAFHVPRQATIWTGGFLVYALLCGYAAWRLYGSHHAEAAAETMARKTVEPPTDIHAPTRRQRLLWLVWPTFGSVALLATTNRVTVDIAAMPFLWVVPLTLYLLTFIIAFDRPSWYRRTPLAVLMLIFIYATAAVHHLGVGSSELTAVGTPGLVYSWFLGETTNSLELEISTTAFLVINLISLFAVCMLCHGELVRQRPHPRYLTAFYLTIAAGGALGGALVSLAAPQLFTTYYEWELMLFVASIVGIGFLLRAVVDLAFGAEEEGPPRLSKYAMLGGVVLVVFLPAAVMLLDLIEFLQPPGGDVRFRTRNFYGALSVIERNPDNPRYHHFYLKHGAITHGSQFAGRREQPTTYYARSTGVARAIDYYRRELDKRPMKLGVVGLGTGTLAAYADGGDTVIFYEINPAVVKIAESGRWFTYLEDARQRGAHCEVHLGDARLTLRRELNQASPLESDDGEALESTAGGQNYHLLILDAFSGDAIPVHLLTAEAFELYLPHLTAAANSPQGAVAVHISNRYIDLRPVVHAAALHFGLQAIYIRNEDENKTGTYSADWVILTRNEELAKELAHFASPLVVDAAPVLWTDAHSSLVNLLK